MFSQLESNMFLGNRVIDYILALGMFFFVVIVAFIFEQFFLKKIKKLASLTSTSIDDFIVKLVQSIFLPAAYCAAFYLCLNYLKISPMLKKTIDSTAMAVLTFFAVRFVIVVITYFYTVFWRKRGKNVQLETSLSGILRLIKFIVWAVAIVFLLDNLGFKISAVIAGLGIGGVAVALAAQAVLADLFSYFAILFDNPFEIGDFIIIGDFLGSVENIGIKTTRIRSLSGEQIVFSNTDLTNSRVRNYKRMDKRRVVFTLGVTYETSLELLRQIPEIIKNIITTTADTSFDRAHFLQYGDFSLKFEVVYYVLSSDYNRYMDIQQDINFRIRESFDSKNIDFAYPTQTIYLEK
ncbi:MAG: mechanosensitive ion channel family protein [Candidatus Omnitrophica bacterium]|nr:mechanosensitive ion channel family protein [Candidatus Omnitrophota bacterium]